MSDRFGGLGGDWAELPPIAVVGMGAVLPGAGDLDALRRLLAGREPRFGLVPEERWDWRRYHGAGGEPDRTPCHRGAFLDPIPFVPRDFGMPPSGERELHRMEKALLVAAHEALAGAGAAASAALRTPRGAVILGMMGLGTPSQRNVVFRARLGDALAAVRATPAFKALAPDRREALLARAEALFREGQRDADGHEDGRASVYSSAAAARVARMAGVRGPHRVVDAACASSFAALLEAVQGLHDGRFDTVITGGASPQITPLLLVGLGPLGVLAEHEVTPFRAEGGGTLLGEGATVLVLRRLQDALRDGDRVRAVVRGMGVAGSRGRRALFTSDAEGQASALRMAYARAGFGPGDVQYVEAHANGVPEGDRVELEALSAVFAPEVAGRGVALGSLKDRIGYLLSGAGAAGIARTILAMEAGVLPHQASEVVPEGLPAPFRLATRPEPWTPARAGLPLRAGISAFGFGGVNFHLAIESFSPAYHQGPFAPPRRRSLGQEPVAVLGMGAVLPGSAGTDALWANLATGRDLARDQADTWFARMPRDWEGVRGAFSPRAARVEGFRADPARLRIPPRSAERMDPSHLWLLSAAEEALDDAGLRGALPARTAVFVAATPGTPLMSDLELRVAYAEFDAALGRAAGELGLADDLRAEAERAFRGPLPRFSEDSLLGTLRNVAAGRLAQALGATGPCYAVDAACASGCAALESAVRGLLAGEFDAAVVGSFWSGLTAEYFLNTAVIGGNGAGVARPFDARADGSPASEGAVVVVLQRERDARAAGLRVHARVSGMGASGNGGGGSLYSASVPGMTAAMREALAEAGTPPAGVGLVEAHGACVPAGDATELRALGSVYGGTDRAAPLALACTKSTLGNLMPVSSLASLVGAVLSVRHGVVPPTPHSRWEEEGGALRLPATPRRWDALPGQPRRAAVSAYAMGGVNYHVVLEAARSADGA